MYKKVLCSLFVLVLGSTYAFADGVKMKFKEDTGSFGIRDDGGSAERILCANKNENDSCSPANAPKNSGICRPNSDKNGATLSCIARECNDGYVLWLTNKRKDPGNLYASQGRCDSIKEIDEDCAKEKHTHCGEGERYKIKIVPYKNLNGKTVNAYVGQDSCGCFKEREIEVKHEVGVVYNCGDGEGEPPVDTEKYDIYKTAIVHVKYNTCRPKEGFKFANWKCGSKIVPAGGSFVIAKDTTCTAQWEELPKSEPEVTLSVDYNCGGGDGEPPIDEKEYKTGDTVTTLSNRCKKDGSDFLSWLCGGEQVAEQGTFTITGNTTCSAEWKNSTPVITGGDDKPEDDGTLSVDYNCGSGVGEAPVDDSKYKSGDTVTTLSNSCEKDGSDFLSWLCGEEQVAAQGTFTITDNTTCSAEWKDDPITRMNSDPTVLPNGDPSLRPSSMPDPELEKKRTKAHNMVSGLSTAATGIGAMEMAQAISEKKADEEAERDMKAYLETMRCNYQKGPEYKYSTEDILLPGGNELLAYYTEYKNLAEEVKAAKTALGMKPGIETEVVYDKAESGLYHYENIGKTGGAYASLSNALLDANSEDAAAWDAEKEKTKKRLIAGATVAGVGAVGGFVGDKLVDKHFDKLENQQISGNTQTKVVTSSYKYEWTEETEEVLERNGITITREEFYEKINDPEFIGTLVGLLGASKGQ